MVCGQGGFYVLGRGGRTFGWLGIQGQSDGYLVRNIFEGSFAEEVTRAGKSIFGGGFKFADSEARKKLYITNSPDQGEIGGRSGS